MCKMIPVSMRWARVRCEEKGHSGKQKFMESSYHEENARISFHFVPKLCPTNSGLMGLTAGHTFKVNAFPGLCCPSASRSGPRRPLALPGPCAVCGCGLSAGPHLAPPSGPASAVPPCCWTPGDQAFKAPAQRKACSQPVHKVK